MLNAQSLELVLQYPIEIIDHINYSKVYEIASVHLLTSLIK